MNEYDWMEWDDKENRIAVIAIYKVGMEPNTIFKTLYTLGIGQMFVYWAIDKHNEIVYWWDFFTLEQCL